MGRVTKVRLTGLYSLELTFNDGLRKELDFEPELWGEVFEPLRDPAYFAKVKLDRVAGTIVWPNEADFAPEFLYDYKPEKRKAAS